VRTGMLGMTVPSFWGKPLEYAKIRVFEVIRRIFLKKIGKKE
jgi:hypothetical protein